MHNHNKDTGNSNNDKHRLQVLTKIPQILKFYIFLQYDGYT